MLIVFCSGQVTGAPVIRFCSFPKAIRLPEKVTVPINVPAMMLTPESTVITSVPPRRRKNSEIATSAEAPPPKPLKMPTICGMAVICTACADTPPMSAPTIAPTRIICQFAKLVSSSVTMMARAIPVAAMMLPDLAVVGDCSLFNPKMKSAAATR